MSELRDRVAATIKTVLMDEQSISTCVEAPPWLLFEGSIDPAAVADAVIAELGLRTVRGNGRGIDR